MAGLVPAISLRKAPLCPPYRGGRHSRSKNGVALLAYARPRRVSLDSHSGAFVEQMDLARVRLQPDPVARIKPMALSEHRDDLLAAEPGEYLDLRARRLDHDDLRVGA